MSTLTKDAEQALRYAGTTGRREISVSFNVATRLFGDGYADEIIRSKDQLEVVAGKVLIKLSNRGADRGRSLVGKSALVNQYGR